MRGRDKFKKFKPIVSFFSGIFRILPRTLRWKYFQHLRYKKGIFYMGLRYAVLKTIVKSLGENVSIHEGVYILNPENLQIGNNVSIHPMCYIDAFGNITIGDNVSIAHGVTILSANHQYKDYDKMINDQGVVKRPLKIENNIWIGAKATLLGGITVKSGTIIAAGAVVTKNYGENVVLAGIPAKVIKMR